MTQSRHWLPFLNTPLNRYDVVTLGVDMRRREFLVVLSCAAAWPPSVKAQHADRVRRIGVLMNLAADDPVSQRRLTAFVQSLQQLGWTDGRNIQLDVRWGAGDADRYRKFAHELVGLKSEVIVAPTAPVVAALRQTTTSVPIVFVQVIDPVGAGFVESLARPGGNATGFMQFEYGLSGKLLELLKEIAPEVSRVAVLRDASSSAGIGQFAAMQAVAPSFGVELRPIDLHNAREIEQRISDFAQSKNAGLIVPGSTLATYNRQLIVSLAAQHRLPAIYSNALLVAGGGLAAYGPDRVDHYRQAASYVDRILKDEKPADLPVQAPIKYEIVINLKTAKALGITVPPTLLARADEVIE